MDIKNATLKDLVKERLDLVEAILNGEHEGQVNTSVEKNKDGTVIKWTEEKRDIDGVLQAKRVDDYTLNQISMKWFDGKNKLIRTRISK